MPFSIKTFECFLVARQELEAIGRMLTEPGRALHPEDCVPSSVLSTIACEILETRLTWIQVKGIIGSEAPTRDLKYSERAVLSREPCVFGCGEAKEGGCHFWVARCCLVASKWKEPLWKEL